MKDRGSEELCPLDHLREAGQLYADLLAKWPQSVNLLLARGRVLRLGSADEREIAEWTERDAITSATAAEVCWEEAESHLLRLLQIDNPLAQSQGQLAMSDLVGVWLTLRRLARSRQEHGQPLPLPPRRQSASRRRT